MQLIKKRIGELVKLHNKKNTEDKELPFFGINREKAFMPTVASTETLDRKKYKVLSKGVFVFSGMQTGRDGCIRIGLYDKPFEALISPAYITFTLKSNEILPEYFFMFFNSSEKDRYGAFLSDSSVRSNLDWEVFCNIEIAIPEIYIQKKYVDIFMGMKDNLYSLRSSINDTERMCELLLDDVKKKTIWKPLEPYLMLVTDKNDDGKERDFIGVSKEGFVTPRQSRPEDSFSKCSVVHFHDFVYNASRINIGSIMYSSSHKEMCCSEEYVVFHIINEDELLPEYLFLWLKRSECGRYLSFVSMDSVRNRVYFDDLKKISIPIPDFTTQMNIAQIYRAYATRKEIVRKLERQLKTVCPVLIRGSVEEGSR